MEPELHPFERVLHGLVLKDVPVATLVGMSEEAAALSLADGSRVLVFRYPPGHDQAFAERLKQITAQLQAGILLLVVAGGDAGVQNMLRRAQPFWMIKRRVGIVHLADDGSLWVGPHTSGLNPLVRRLKEVSRSAAPAADPGLYEQLRLSVRPEADATQEVARFGMRLRGVRPWATYVMAAVCAGLMLLEVLWGSSRFPPTLVRLGANVSSRVIEGEWYRLVSSMFLHGGLQHFLCNMFVLVYLGGFLERLLGLRRFVVLFAISGVAGSLASAFLSDALLSVGASGALWGILGASAALAYWPRGLVPQPVIVRLKRAAIVNLGLNLFVSFLPQVDLFAHLGGGLAGALLVATGWLSPQRAASQDASAGANTRRAPWLTPLALAAGLTLAGSLVWAIVAGRAWQLDGPVTWERKVLNPIGLSLEVPGFITGELKNIEWRGGHEYVLGSIDSDVLMLDIVAARSGIGAKADLEPVWKELKQEYRSQQPQGATRIVEVRQRTINDVRTLMDAFVYPNGLKLHRYSQIRSSWLLTIRIISWPEVPIAVRVDLDRLVGSLVEVP